MVGDCIAYHLEFPSETDARLLGTSIRWVVPHQQAGVIHPLNLRAPLGGMV